MKQLMILTTLLMMTGSLVAQGDRGGVGRDGGSRDLHEERRAQTLEENNDPRFLPHRLFISQKLQKSVRQVVVDYDRTQKKGIQLSPQQFVTVEYAAKETGLDAQTLAANTGRYVALGKQKGTKLALAAHSDDEFKDQLAKSLARMAGLSDSEAQQKASASLASVKAMTASQK
jgi:hypothetical protein